MLGVCRSFVRNYSKQSGWISSKFELNEEFLAKKRRQALLEKSPFGFSGLGEFVYRRTYAREGEEWIDTVSRVVSGTMRMYESHLSRKQSGARPDKEVVQDLAQEMFESIYSIRFLPPGRGLWAMGSTITEERGIFAALNNCGFISTKDLARNPVDPFTFMMDASMLGVGVGFDTLGADQVEIVDKFHVRGQFTYIIPDSREGWIESLQLLLKHYLVPGNHYPTFNYSLIRPAGAPIKGFGGVSGGPEPLRHALEEIDLLLKKDRGLKLSLTHIVDIMNIIGKCIVSGNVRRTAEIAFGQPDSEEFLNLKNYAMNPRRSAFGWTSNNSIMANLGMDYRPIVKRVIENGEPGFIWMDNCRAFSRMDGNPDHRDQEAMGSNPCLEQTLFSHELCCLVETFPSRHSKLKDFLRTLELAFFYAKVVTLGPTHWPQTNKVMTKNRRIGTSLSGITQFIAENGMDTLKKWCTEGYTHLKVYDHILSSQLEVPMSIKRTSIKPSGTVSLLAGATPGMHYPISSQYIRRVRLPSNSPLLGPLTKAGYTIEDAQDGMKGSTKVVEFPISISDEKIPKAEDVTIWQQLSLAAFLQRYWADNSVSCTVSFDPEKVTEEELATALDFYQYQLKGISFLPQTKAGAYPQMPYEPIETAEYQRRIKAIRPIDWTNESRQFVEEKVHTFCDNDTCELKN